MNWNNVFFETGFCCVTLFHLVILFFNRSDGIRMYKYHCSFEGFMHAHFMVLFFAAGRRVGNILKRKLSFRPAAFFKINSIKNQFSGI